MGVGYRISCRDAPLITDLQTLRPRVPVIGLRPQAPELFQVQRGIGVQKVGDFFCDHAAAARPVALDI